MNARTPDVTFAGGAAPTHRCKICGALWRLSTDIEMNGRGTWNLRSKECGSCCDNVAMGDQIEALPAKGCDCVGQEACEVCAEPALEPSDELEWLREQYVVLKQNNDSLRQAYSAVGQEASALRRAMASRQPTLRERAAIAALVPIMAENKGSMDEWVTCAVAIADALVAALKADPPVNESTVAMDKLNGVHNG